MSNITLSLEKEDIKQARVLALQQGSSLNAVVRQFIKDYIANNRGYQQVTERILQQANHTQFSSEGKKWTRADLYER